MTTTNTATTASTSLRSTIELPLPRDVPADVRQALRRHLYWVAPQIAEVALVERADGPCLVVDYRGPRPLAAIERDLGRAVAGILAGTTAFTAREVARHSAGPLRSAPAADPFPDLVSRRWVLPEAPGVFGYAGLVAGLLEGLDGFLRRRLGRFRPAAVLLPSLTSPGTLLRTGALPEAAHTAHFVFHLDESLSTTSRFAAECIPDGADALDLRALPGTSAAPDAVLAPAACQPFYRTLSDQVLREPVVVTGRASCYRYESGATETLRRLTEYRVRELIVVGSAAQVAAIRAELLEFTIGLLAELSLDGRLVTASDPFFVDAFARMRSYQLAMEVKHELLLSLPFDGSEVAGCSVNHHGEHFGRAWNIRTADGNPAQSCCLGFGLERWAYAVLAQYGTDPAAWPDELRRISDGSSAA
ncbi:hypothetical protein [Kitasatospora viridis]|uniref:Aminoacyl-transfer RNA synthetases class-II family profile domain-containing protein n=1 Tax=Kitasatospora viridis TaxID=281105 RepID=A0A561T6G1_9ACTN|nr:hypothetical protein [Kitasatospora viridis]TWF82669.1 hypothetical protein FHX73_14151 [Kitasatospora viridis]